MPELVLEQPTISMPRLRMSMLVMRAFTDLVFYDLAARFAGFPAIRAFVKRTRRKNRFADANLIRAVCGAVDIASCFYFRRVLCMHRSFVAVRLLRKSGVNAELVIASRPIPFVSHAWVEVDGRVVNDKQGYKRRLIEMERM
jgi:hypothetical protein